MKFDLERMCRLDGKKSTVKEQWIAFYRVLRMCQKAYGDHMYAEHEIKDCFRVIFWNYAGLMVLSQEDQSTLPRSAMPKFLRRLLIENERRRRLGCWGKKALQRTTRELREKGIEVTPDQVAEVRLKVTKLVRDRALADGVPLPKNDEALWELLRRVE